MGIIRAAFDSGVTFFDTAEVYGPFTNESRRGYRMTGVDWSSEFLHHAAITDAAREVTWERRDMRDLPWRARFDGAGCVGNSFGYLDDTGNADFL